VRELLYALGSARVLRASERDVGPIIGPALPAESAITAPPLEAGRGDKSGTSNAGDKIARSVVAPCLPGCAMGLFPVAHAEPSVRASLLRRVSQPAPSVVRGRAHRRVRPSRRGSSRSGRDGQNGGMRRWIASIRPRLGTARKAASSDGPICDDSRGDASTLVSTAFLGSTTAHLRSPRQVLSAN
jgi:hypothetical protein